MAMHCALHDARELNNAKVRFKLALIHIDLALNPAISFMERKRRRDSVAEADQLLEIARLGKRQRMDMSAAKLLAKDVYDMSRIRDIRGTTRNQLKKPPEVMELEVRGRDGDFTLHDAYNIMVACENDPVLKGVFPISYSVTAGGGFRWPHPGSIPDIMIVTTLSWPKFECSYLDWRAKFPKHTKFDDDMALISGGPSIRHRRCFKMQCEKNTSVPTREFLVHFYLVLRNEGLEVRVPTDVFARKHVLEIVCPQISQCFAKVLGFSKDIENIVLEYASLALFD